MLVNLQQSVKRSNKNACSNKRLGERHASNYFYLLKDGQQCSVHNNIMPRILSFVSSYKKYTLRLMGQNFEFAS